MAFDVTMADGAFRADIERRSLHIDPVPGEEMARAVRARLCAAARNHSRRT
jgi:hypothetical protein